VKKRFFISILLMFLMLICTSCVFGEPHSAKGLWRRINASMDALDSYEVDISMEMSFSVNGVKVEGTANGRGIEAGRGKEDYYYYQIVRTTLKSNRFDSDKKLYSLQAYHDGMAFISNTGEGMEQKLCSPMEAQAYIEYVGNQASGIGGFHICENAEYAKLENGDWLLTFSGYPEETVEKVAELYGIEGDTLGAEMTDMKVSISAGEDFLVKNLTIDFVFEDKKAGPVISLSSDYSRYNEAKRYTDTLDVEDYVQIEDLRLLNDIEDMLEEIQESEKATFTFESTQTTEGKETYREIDTVTFENREDGFYYNIDADIKGEKYEMIYEKGTLTVKSETKTPERKAQTEKEAKAFIADLINFAGYDKTYVTKVVRAGDNSHILVLKRQNPLAGQGGNSSTQNVTVVIKDDQLVSITTSVTVNQVTAYYYQVVKIKTSVVFQEEP